MDQQFAIIEAVGSVVTTLTVVVGFVLAVIKFGPERRVLAVEASQTATVTMQVAMQELRAELAQQKEKSADMRRESINKDIEHSADIKAQREQIETLQAEAKGERERHEKREKELLARVDKLEKELADTQTKWQAKYAELEAQYEKVVAENEQLRDRVKALEAQREGQEAKGDESKT